MARHFQVPSTPLQRRNKTPQQPKKRKPKKTHTARLITPGWTKYDFEERNSNIMRFTHQSQNLNRQHAGRELERNEIDQRWTHLIQRFYPADDPKSYQLLAQVECPLYDGYWEKRADEKAFFEREQKLEFHTFNKSLWNPTRAQKRNWPGCIIMSYHDLREVVVPKISLLALQQLNYLDFVKSVLHANPLKNISQFTMEELWVAVVTKIYHFEDTLDKEVKIGETKECSTAEYHALVEDYRTAYEVAKARVEAKRAMEEDKKREREDTASREENDEDGHDGAGNEQQEVYDRNDRARKRQKTQKSERYVQVEGTNDEAGKQYLETEEDKIDAFHFDEAAWSNFGGEENPLADFTFADTGLPLRFKG